MGFPDPATPLEDVVFCALDLETTGLSPITSAIVEVGAIRFDIYGNEKDVFHSLVDPGVPIPPGVISIHGIDDAMVRGAPSFEDISRELEGFLGETLPVIHNPLFDLAFLETGGVTGFKALDTVRLARRFLPGRPSYRLDRLAGGPESDLRFHRALDDARACGQVFLEIAGAAGIDPGDTLGDCLAVTGKPVGTSLRKRKGGKWFHGSKKDDILVIRYRDVRGQETERAIRPLERYSRGRKRYLRAYCYLREEERVFSEENILESRKDDRISGRKGS
jgi:DNA polymerase III epsilon subunit-like protein